MRPNDMVSAVVRNLPQKTGRTLDEWLAIVRAEGVGGHKQRVDWLKQTYGLGHTTATILVQLVDNPSSGTVPDETDIAGIDALFAGPKAALRPTYDRLGRFVRSLGPDATLEPRKTYVSMQRGRQFGVIQPSSKTRLDLGLRLPGLAPIGRLQPAGTFGSGGVTHRVAVSAPDDVDAEVEGWIAEAYRARG